MCRGPGLNDLGASIHLFLLPHCAHNVTSCCLFLLPYRHTLPILMDNLLQLSAKTPSSWRLSDPLLQTNVQLFTIFFLLKIHFSQLRLLLARA